jgi:acyl carrier protein
MDNKINVFVDENGSPIMDNIDAKVKDIIADKLGVGRDLITWDKHLTKDFGADSLDIVELLLEFEKVFEVSIPDQDVNNIATVGDIVAYFAKRLGNNTQNPSEDNKTSLE